MSPVPRPSGLRTSPLLRGVTREASAVAARARSVGRIRGRGNVVDLRPGWSFGARISIRGSGNSIVLGRDASIRNVSIEIWGDGCTVDLAEGVKFQSGGRIVLEDSGGRVTIGAGSTFVQADLLVSEPGSSITIGRDCLFAHGVEIRSGDSHPIFDEDGTRLNPALPVVIGDHVWVGAQVMLLRGARLPDGCVVGARSLVTRGLDAGSGCLVTGSPAEMVRSGVRWSRYRAEQQ